MVYSIYYMVTLVLPCMREERRLLKGMVAVGEQETLSY